MTLREYDIAIVGAGILGLAHAYHCAARGLRVIVFERGVRATGASIRNFGMIWPIGQPAGDPLRLATKSLETWLEVLGKSGLWHERSGSLHLAYHEDEEQVLREFMMQSLEDQFDCSWLSAAEVHRLSPWVGSDGPGGGFSVRTKHASTRVK